MLKGLAAGSARTKKAPPGTAMAGRKSIPLRMEETEFILAESSQLTSRPNPEDGVRYVPLADMHDKATAEPVSAGPV
jgi:hypothetical protein